MQRKTWLDALKGIAICGVIMTHSGEADMSSFVGTIGRLGRNGVQMFLEK